MARESFTLLNLTDTESESVPDLDLVLPAARKQSKRKVKLKRRERSGKPCKAGGGGGGGERASPGDCWCLPAACSGSGAAAPSPSPHPSSSSWCGRAGGAALLLLLLSALLAYAALLFNAKILSLERRLLAVDDASKSVPETILQLQALVDKLQENQTVVITSLERVGERLDTLEKGMSKAGTPPQGDLQGVQQGLADLGGKLAEVKQSIEAASSRSAANSQSLQMLENELNSLKLNEIDMKNGGSVSGDESISSSSSEEQLRALNSSLAATRQQLVLLQEVAMSALNQSLVHLGQNTSARLDWLDRDVQGLQAKFSQMEDDNRNMSSRVGSLAVSCTADLQLIRQEVAAALHSAAQPPPPAAPPPEAIPPPAAGGGSITSGGGLSEPSAASSGQPPPGIRPPRD